MRTLAFIGLPLLECLVLVGIHSYLGMHVIRRKVIFVDLALAQLAALGTTVGFLFGIMPETPASLVFGLLFATAGAAVFATTRMRGERIPHEAVIGLSYAIAAAVAILVIDRAPTGAEHLRNVLVGRIELVRGREVLTAAIVYSAVGVVHWIFRERFYLISEDPEGAWKRGLDVKAWDFLFYLTFGIVISISVSVAGVLLVFVFLVVPAIAAVLLTEDRLRQLLVGWGLGTAVTVVGMILSYHASLPSGPTVVALYGAALVAIASALFVWRSARRLRSALLLLAGLGATAAFAGIVVLAGTIMGASPIAAGGDEHASPPEGHVDAAAAVAADPDEILEGAGARMDGPERGRALSSLSAMLHDGRIGSFYRSRALALVEEAAGRDFAYDPDSPPSASAPALAAIDAWIAGGGEPAPQGGP